MIFCGPSGAIFSEDRVYRHLLWRINGPGPLLMMLMLNPSIADAERSDPTVSRQIKRAHLLGCCGGLIVANAYDLVSTDPRALKTHPAPLSPHNNRYITEAARHVHESGGKVIAGWGAHCSTDRQNYIHSLFQELDIPLLCLGQNEDMSPRHPLYIGYSVQPAPWLYF
jgi:hypothetical protein